MFAALFLNAAAAAVPSLHLPIALDIQLRANK
jgi:hypothetical protein